MEAALFDTWTERYDSWFETPAGRYVKKYEMALLLNLLNPQQGDLILDGGCGTGLFTEDVISYGTRVFGVDRSLPMVARGCLRLKDGEFDGVCGDMSDLPFADNSFDRVFSMTAIEFIADAGSVICELSRVAKTGASIVVTTLNSLSPWAEQRRRKARRGHSLFQNIIFRSPEDMRQLVPAGAVIKTAVHFKKDESVDDIPRIEEEGCRRQLETGAFLAVQWQKQ